MAGVAASEIWLTDHLVLLVSGLLLLGGLIALRKSITGQPGTAKVARTMSEAMDDTMGKAICSLSACNTAQLTFTSYQLIEVLVN